MPFSFSIFRSVYVSHGDIAMLRVCDFDSFHSGAYEKKDAERSMAESKKCNGDPGLSFGKAGFPILYS